MDRQALAPTATIIRGDARKLPLGDNTIDLAVTSPPYFGLRDYGSDAEIGGEDTLKGYLAAMREVLAELARVLTPTGSAFLVIGDKYARTGGVDRKPRGNGADPGGRAHQRRPQKGIEGVPDKSLAGIPYRVALDALDDGWLWRQDIVWSKPNPLPESVRDRSRRAHETILHLTRRPRYYAADEARDTLDVWTMPVAGYRDPKGRRHPAVFPEPLAARIIRAYCPEGGTVLDPFLGSGTTLAAALKTGRSGIGVELSPDYAAVAYDRLADYAPTLL